ncbi:peptidyl-prolyl cis-trans isomerase-like 4 isoform X5 [Ovis canadensis]|uniref:peptidyl-prolyl cis-trans isomerase-like 4 isoform X5 n=1 Tax=Ovis canadensis TaxID=37174 RepID=UPI003752A25D
MARMNIDILEISELKWTGMGEFNSGDYYIYYCEQESLRRNRVAVIFNKKVQNAVLGCSLKNDRMISYLFPRQTIFTVIQVYAPTTNAEEIEVERFYEDLQDFLQLTSKKDVLVIIGDWNAKVESQEIPGKQVGDLPDADIKPPENVLFVCKLNPVTTDEDLEIIFSRFGPIRSCEVIRDWKTGESLCYAFIEFEKEEDCEKAFFKMDNVLIDDRRIHVDFSQSVAKVKWKGKGGKYTKSDFKEYEKEQDKPSNLVLKDKVKPKQDAKYELVLDEQAEDSKASHSHTSKKHKKKTRHCSEEKEDEDYMPIKNTNQDIYREMGFGHYEEEESCWEKQKSEKRDRPQNRSRSRSRERDGHYSNSHKSKYQADPYERERSKKRDRSRSPRKSKDKEKSKYR